MADRDAQMRAEQIAQQQLQNNLSAWSSYMQSVNARQPQTINLKSNCTTSKIGNVVTTNCN